MKILAFIVESKTSKSVIWAVIITLIITFVISFLIFKYFPESSQNSKINAYKKELYTSTLCQYSCPLTLQDIQNKTGLFPEQECVKNCTSGFKAIQSTSDDISNNQIKKDGLIDSMANVINSCKTESLNTTSMTLNNTLFFSCSVDKLGSLKGTYSYLN